MKPQYRTKPKGQSNAGWMCIGCIQVLHPELAANIKEEITDTERALYDICYPKSAKPWEPINVFAGLGPKQ